MSSFISRQVVIDVEADGPCPGLFSIVSIGAVSLDEAIDPFFCKCAPISDRWVPEALAVSGITREEHLTYPDPQEGINSFRIWAEAFSEKRISTWSDNPAFDWQFINYYFHRFSFDNPFGHSMRRIGDLYAGYGRNWTDHSSWKRLRKTKHTHNPVDDAKGNAEALRFMIKGTKNG